MGLRINGHLAEERQIGQRPKQLAREDRPEVDHLFRTIVETHTKGKWRNDLEFGNAENWVVHLGSLQGRYRQWRLPRLQTLPVSEQFFLMKFCPRFNEPALPPR